MTRNEGIALSDQAVSQIEKNINLGYFNDHEFARLIETIRIQKKVLNDLFNLFQDECLGTLAIAHAIRVATLNDYKRLTALEDRAQ